MFVIYTDGGADRGGSAAAAAIVEPPSGERCRVVGHLGAATNNEAEIAAALIGLAAVHLLAEGDDNTGHAVSWFADSEYTLLSATKYIQNWERNGWKTAQKEPVKNQGLWRIYSRLASGLRIKANHVRGHTGHPENEACDEACNWLKTFAPTWDREPLIEDLPFDNGSWLVIDIEPLLVFSRTFTAQSSAATFAEEGADRFRALVTPLVSSNTATPVDRVTQFRTAALRFMRDVRQRAALLPGDAGHRERFLQALDDVSQEVSSIDDQE